MALWWNGSQVFRQYEKCRSVPLFLYSFGRRIAQNSLRTTGTFSVHDIQRRSSKSILNFLLIMCCIYSIQILYNIYTRSRVLVWMNLVKLSACHSLGVYWRLSPNYMLYNQSLKIKIKIIGHYIYIFDNIYVPYWPFYLESQLFKEIILHSTPHFSALNLKGLICENLQTAHRIICLWPKIK